MKVIVGSELRIFAYLRPTVPRVDALLSALEACGAQVLYPMHADLTVTYGGQGLIARSLLAGEHADFDGAAAAGGAAGLIAIQAAGRTGT